MLRRSFLGAAAGAAALAGGVRPASAEEWVDVLLVLAVDVSRSVDEEEARLQREGYISALSDPEVMEAIRGGMLGAVGITYIEWSGADDQRMLVPWSRIASDADAQKWCEELRRQPTQSIGWTSISSAIDYSRRAIEVAPWHGMRKVIDVSGDGSNNSGRPAQLARDEAVGKGVIINGLPILNKQVRSAGEPPLDQYYAEHVIGGPGSFVVPAADFQGLAKAVRRKLIMEIAGVSLPGAVIRA